MNRVDIFLSDSASIKIVLSNSQTQNRRVFAGSDVSKILTNLYSEKPLGYKEQEDQNRVFIKYNDFILSIYNCDIILNNKNIQSALRPIFENVKRLEEKNKVAKLGHKKVKRENKHVNTKIIAGSLVAITLLLASHGLLKGGKNAIPEENFDTASIVVATEDDELKLTQNLDMHYDSLSKSEDTTEPTISEPAIGDTQFVSLSYKDRTTTPKAIEAIENYKPIIEKYSLMYGLDPNLIMALATQERGVHSGEMDRGGATGLMQIQNSQWVNKSLTAFNFETNSPEEIVISKEGLSDLEYNIKVACMIFQNSLKESKYNILLALQNYNMGFPAINKMLNNYCADTGKSKQDVMADQCDNGWMTYRDIVGYGDEKYIENVLSYYGDVCNISVLRPDHTEVSVCVKSVEQQKVY